MQGKNSKTLSYLFRKATRHNNTRQQTQNMNRQLLTLRRSLAILKRKWNDNIEIVSLGAFAQNSPVVGSREQSSEL
jgi:hypothetical protein